MRGRSTPPPSSPPTRAFVTDNLHRRSASAPADRPGIRRPIPRRLHFLTVLVLTGAVEVAVAVAVAAPTATATTSTSTAARAAGASTSRRSKTTAASPCPSLVAFLCPPRDGSSRPPSGFRRGHIRAPPKARLPHPHPHPHPHRTSSPNRPRASPDDDAVKRSAMSGTKDDGGGGGEASSWSPSPLNLLNVDPEALASPSTDGSRPRMAKTAEYAHSVQSAWRAEMSDRGGGRMVHDVVGGPMRYRDGEGNVLHGHVVRTAAASTARTTTTGGAPPPPPPPLVPGIVFFHTGAGPHDLFLHWRAHSLASDFDTFPSGCVVLVADVIGDDVGWGWDDDKSRYESCRKKLLEIDGRYGSRPRLRTKIHAAVDALRSVDGVDGANVAAVGWCLGGQCVAELVRMGMGVDGLGVRAAVSFHGVFDGIVEASSAAAAARASSPSSGDVEGGNKRARIHGDAETAKDDEDEEKGSTATKLQLLLCHGRDDPYVAREDLLAVRGMANSVGWRMALLEFDGVRHGFTNPAQRFNPNPKFGYDEVAADVSWRSAVGLLRSCLSKEKDERQDGT